MKLSKAKEGFLLFMRADGYSENTVSLYSYALSVLQEFLGDVELKTIKLADLTAYLAYLRTGYQPRRMTDNKTTLAGSTLQNHWKAIRSFFNWASTTGLVRKRPDQGLPLPKNDNPRVILPFTEVETKALIKAAEYTPDIKPKNRAAYTMRRRTADRDLAIILVLLDTGLRAGEVGRLNIRDVDLASGEVYVAPFGSSNRKTKSRTVYLGKAARRALWSYLSKRDEEDRDAPLFLSEHGRRMDDDSIRHLLVDLGAKVGIDSCHPHRFRHTFAIEFLRGGGDVFSLQRILGHSTLTMVLHYLDLANADTANAHRKASPADRWRL